MDANPLPPTATQVYLPATVIVCAFEGDAAAIHRSLDAVFRSHSGAFEALVVIPPDMELPDLAAWSDQQVRVVRTTNTTPGVLRQQGVRAATGEIIAWCDAGDEWLPGHLEDSLLALAADPLLGFVWSPWSGPDGSTRMTDTVRVDEPPASAVVHRRAAIVHAGGFDLALPAYESTDLCLRMLEDGPGAPVERAGGCLVRDRMPNSARGVEAVRREVVREAAERATRHRQSEERVARRLATGARFEPASWSSDRHMLAWRGSFSGDDSFGIVALGLSDALGRLGVTVRRVSRQAERAGADGDPETRGAMAMCSGFPLAPAALPNEIVLAYSVLESTRLSSVAVREWNRTLTMLYMPCRHNSEACLAHGVTVPVRTLHHGVDPARFPMLERSRSGTEPFTFGSFSSFSPRKGIDVLVRAFRDEFLHGEPVRLALHSTRPTPGITGAADDGRISMSVGFLEMPALLAYLRGLDVFVLPSRGEGFGLTGLGAMATGLPLIATNWSGPADYLDASDSFSLDYELVDLGGQRVNGSRRWWGEWAEPSYEHLRQLLRYLYDHPQAARAAGMRAATRVHARWTWERPARQLLRDLDAIAAGVTPPEDLADVG